MRKKILIEQNAVFFKEIEALKGEIAELKNEINKRDKQIAELIEQNQFEAVNKSPLEKIEERVMEQAEEENISQYGAKAIGRIVVAVSEATTFLASSPSISASERINLILGRSEVAKAEILKTVSSDEDFKAKKIKTDSIVEKALEYINCTKAQKI